MIPDRSKRLPFLWLSNWAWLAGRKPGGESTAREVLPPVSEQLGFRTVGFVAYGLLSLLAFWVPLSTLVRFSFQYEHSSHILLIPPVSACLIYWNRRRIFVTLGSAIGAGTLLLLASGLAYGWAETQSLRWSQNDYLSLTAFSVVLAWMGGFVLCYGARAFRAALFPLLFLGLVVPLPDFVLERTIHVLQAGSAEATHGLFKLAGVPVFREGFRFSLPGIAVEVAEECSGIRSSLALFITSLLAGHLFLRSSWRKVSLSLSIFPILVVKNGLRIVALSWLALYVDRSFLTGSLHRYGGMPFFLLALAFWLPVLWLLQRSETKAEEARVETRAETKHSCG